MKLHLISVALALVLLALCGAILQLVYPSRARAEVFDGLRSFAVTGVVERIEPSKATLVVKHEDIPGYMPAMSMPFQSRSPLNALQVGDSIEFRLCVTTNSSWIDQIVRRSNAQETPKPLVHPASTNAPPVFLITQIPDFALTNEFGQRTSLHQFRGQAVALTFFFTRCPIPEFCPRLSKSFAEASQRLESMTNGPANWHLLSISFDPLDTPAVLRQYAQRYGYDSNHWTFLTGDPVQIRQLTRGFGLSVVPEAGIFSHDFRTVVFDASGQLQTMWPFGGNTTDLLVNEILKATEPPKRLEAGSSSNQH
jgi:protein SCO1/2